MGKSKHGIEAYKKIMEKGSPGQAAEESFPETQGFVKTGQFPEEIRGLNKVPANEGKTANKNVEKKLDKPDKNVEKKPVKPASKYKRAAQFMLLIGSDEASKILSRLDSTQIEAISKEIVFIKSIPPEEAEAVLEEFRSLLSPGYGYSGSSSGGVDEARRILYAAFGPEKGEAMLLKAAPDAAENPFDFLKDFSGEQLALLFKDESPAACAMVFSRLPAKLSASLLANTSAGRKLDIVKRIAHLGETSPEVIERVAAALREKARHFGKDDSGGEIDGRGILAAILKHSDISFGGLLLDELEENDPSLGREMKDRLYTLEDVCDASDRPIQDKLRTMDNREIALLLRGRSDEFTRKIMWNLSSARAAQVKEESEIIGAVPKIEAEAAAREFLAWFRVNREEGRILMLSGEDVLV